MHARKVPSLFFYLLWKPWQAFAKRSIFTYKSWMTYVSSCLDVETLSFLTFSDRRRLNFVVKIENIASLVRKNGRPRRIWTAIWIFWHWRPSPFRLSFDGQAENWKQWKFGSKKQVKLAPFLANANCILRPISNEVVKTQKLQKCAKSFRRNTLY